MSLTRYSYEKRPFQHQHFPRRWGPFSADIRTELKHPLGPSMFVSHNFTIASFVLHTSIKQKLGVGSAPSAHHPVPSAPVALPGLTKNFPSSSYASNLCVPPHNSTSTSICLAAISKLSASPGGIIVCPCVNPIRSDPCVTTLERARFGASTSKSPLTICKSGAICRRKS